MKFHGRTWVEINLSALIANVEAVRSMSQNKKIIAVVKANAYGHGDHIICPELAKCGVRHFAVSCFYEASHIQPYIENSDILIFGFTEREYFIQAADRGFILTVGDIAYAKELSACMQIHKKSIRVHIKLNTGMNRVGINTLAELDEILSLPGLECEALYTHFSSADSLCEDDMRFTDGQQEKLLLMAQNKNLKIHSQNSGGLLLHSGFKADYIRVGLALYGLSPISGNEPPIKLTPVMSFKSTICQIRVLEKGEYVSYGRTYTAPGKRLAAVIPAGYADGYSRLHSNNGAVAVKNTLCPVIGRVCMDQLIIDVTNVPDVKVGEEVLLYSKEYEETSVEHIAEKLGTIPYEVTCSVSHRVPRIEVNPPNLTT